MDNTIIFVMQVASVVAYIGATFGLYRLLVSQKDATIEGFKEHINLLKQQLEAARSETPLAVAEILSRRVKVTEDELKRLSEDKERDEQLMKQKEDDLARARQDLEEYEAKLQEAQIVLSEYLCPICGAKLDTRTYHYESVEYEGRDLDIDHEIIRFECGYEILDGQVGTHPNKD